MITASGIDSAGSGVNRTDSADTRLRVRVAEYQYIVIGCGAVGSHIAPMLARAGAVRFELFDPDSVERHNVHSQGFGALDIGRSKPVAVANYVQDVAPDATIKIRERAWTPAERTFARSVLVLCPDRISVRELACQWARKHPVEWIIDVRMSRSQSTVFVVDMHTLTATAELERAYYDRQFWPDAESWAERCTNHSTVHCAAGSAALALSMYQTALVSPDDRAAAVRMDWRNLSLTIERELAS